MLNWNKHSSKFHSATVGAIDLVVLQRASLCDWEIRVGSGVLSCGISLSVDEAKRDAETSLRTIAVNVVKVLS